MPDYFEIKAVAGTGIEDNVLYYGESGRVELDLYPKNKTFSYNSVNWFVLDGSSQTVSISNRFNSALIKPKKTGYVEIDAEIEGIYSLGYFPLTVKVPNVKLNNPPYKNILCVGQNQSLGHVVEPSDATVTWSIERGKNLATISGNTLVPQKSGTVVLKANINYNNNKKSYSQLFTFKVVELYSLFIYGDDYVTVGDSCNLTVEAEPFSKYNTYVTWSSLDTSVATVDANGKVTGKKVGDTTIIATSKINKNIKQYHFFDVYPKASVTINNKPQNSNVKIGQKYDLNVTVTIGSGTDKSVNWESSDYNKATVNEDGVVTFNSGGSVTIYAISNANPKEKDYVTFNVYYCGETAYQDVTKHNMVLQNDGYYVCSICGYRVKSPALQDKDILSEEDYLLLISMNIYVSLNGRLAQENPSSEYVFLLQQAATQEAIGALRRKDEYTGKYEFKDAENKCYSQIMKKHEDMGVNFTASVNVETVDSTSINVYNGIYEFAIETILGLYFPEIALILNISSAMSKPMNVLEFSEFSASLLGLEEVELILNIASAALGYMESDVVIGDKIVDFSVNLYESVRFVYSSDNKLKKVIYNYF